MNDATFAGRTALVTGGHTGIGYGAAVAFARRGANVAIAARRRDVGETAAARLTDQFGVEATFIGADMTQPRSIEAMVAACVDRFGRLDFAFNNAGIPGDLLHRIADSDEERQQDAATVNIHGVWTCMKYEIPEILAAGGGAIVNCSSTSGTRASVLTNMYTATKHAVLGMTKSVAMEYAAKGIRVNAVCPGLTMTEFVENSFAATPERVPQLLARVPMRRAGLPEEIGNVVAWLCSDESTYVTGAAIPVDGGTSI